MRQNIVFIMMLCAFLMGCVFIFLIEPYPGQDFAVYQRLGWNLSQGNGYSQDSAPPYTPLGWRTPLYPLFLAIIYKFFGLNNTIVFLAQAILYSLTTFFLFLITKEILSEKIAYIAGFLFALYPVTAYWGGVLYTETLTAFLLILVTFSLVKYTKTRRIIYFSFACFFTGLSILNRPIFILYPVAILLSFLFLKFSARRIFVNSLLAIGIISISLSPWIIRNYRVYKEFIPLTKGVGAGYAFYVGTIEFRNGWNNTRYHEDPLFLEQVDKMRSQGYIQEGHFLSPLSYMDTGGDKIFYKYAIKNIINEPFLYFSSYFKRFLRLYIGVYNPAFNPLILRLNIVVSALVLLFGLMGIWLLRKELSRIAMLLLPISYVTIIQLPIICSSRYTIPVRPYIMVLVAAVLAKMLQALKNIKIHGKI